MPTNEKVLQTRIVNKHASLNDWSSSNLVLKEGEIALAKLTTILPDGGTEDNFVAKIGVEGKKFSESAWLYAKASDVYGWAKAAAKPNYNSTEIARGGSTVEADLEAAETEINLLKAAIGDGGSVADAIKAAIEALDENTWAAEDGIKFVTAVGETDGKISVTRRALTAADIPALGMDKITGLETALAGKVDNGDFTSAISTINGTIDTNAQTAAKATAAVAEDLAEYVESNNNRVKAIEDDYTTAAQAGSIAEAKVNALANGAVNDNATAIGVNTAAIANLAGDGRSNETVKGNADAIALLREQIGNVANVMNFRGVSVKGEGTVAGHDIVDPKNGDVIIYGDAEYVYNVVDETGTWVKFGDASDNATAISGLQDKVAVIEADLGTDGRITNAIAAADAKGAQGIADALAVKNRVDAIEAPETGYLAQAAATAQDKADKALKDAKDYTDGQIDLVEDSVSTLNGTVTDHIANKSNPHEVDKEDVGLGNVDNKSVAEIKSEFTGAIAADNDGFVKGGDVHTAIEGAKTAANNYTDQEVGKVADELDAAEGNITTIMNNYARVEGNQLVYGQGDAAYVIVFDCGGAN